jgi:hypothetical protein
VIALAWLPAQPTPQTDDGTELRGLAAPTGTPTLDQAQ